MKRVLIVDDETNMRRILGVLLAEDGYAVSEAKGVKEAVRKLESATFDLVITDQKMPDGDGMAVLAACRDIDATLPVIVLTAHATIELAVHAMRQGAFDFVTKPFDPDAVHVAVRRALDHARLLRENRGLKEQVRRFQTGERLIGDSPAIHRLHEMIDRVAPTNATVLITGETGTGKELVARAIHRLSPRRDGPFIAVNCAAMPEPLLESQLFGHERGAFTGADKASQGMFEAADGGTLFLDEAAEMSLPLQAKLLRVLLDGQITRLGSMTPRTVDVRILAATHRNLEQRVQEGSFRQDVYFRLNVVPIHVPPLRDRREDIPLLVEHFLHEVARDIKVTPRPIAADAVQRLRCYDFPGNVRELRNLIERALILGRDTELKASDFPVAESRCVESYVAPSSAGMPWVETLSDTIDLRETVERVECELIQRALRASHGAQAEAARRLGVSRSDLAYKLRKYGLRETKAT